MTNIVSGFLITDRMLKMFKKREPEAMIDDTSPSSPTSSAAALFIFSLQLDERIPKTARRGVLRRRARHDGWPSAARCCTRRSSASTGSRSPS